jgi:hypothetical protein
MVNMTGHLDVSSLRVVLQQLIAPLSVNLTGRPTFPAQIATGDSSTPGLANWKSGKGPTL